MKRWFAFVMVAALLCGCGAQPTFETVDDQDSLVASATTRQILLDLPKEAATPTLESATGDKAYLCNGYTLTVHTLAGGDLDKTLSAITGYTQAELHPIRTKTANATRYDVVWTAAGEGGDQIARAVILDDGQSHYAVTVMADADQGGQLMETWKNVLGSVALSTD